MVPFSRLLSALPFVFGRKRITSSLMGNRADFTDMLALAARVRIEPMIETMPMAHINSAIDHLRDNQQRYRIVLCN